MNATGIKKRNSESGFTLLEAVISLAVLSIGILALFVLITTGIRSNAVANLTTVETRIATDFIERIAALPYDSNLLEDRDNISPGSRFSKFNDDTIANIEAGLHNGLHNAVSPEYSADGSLKVAADKVMLPFRMRDAYSGRYSLGWNVQDDYPFPNAKTIVIIIKGVNNNTSTAFRYIKNRR